MVQLALPVVVVQVGLMLMGTVDVIMTGHFSRVAMSATALGNIYFLNVTIFAMGLLMALDPIVAQAVGAGDTVGVTRGIQRGILLSLALTVATSAALLPAAFLLALLRQPAELVPLAGEYVRVCIPGVLPFLLFVVLRQSLQAMRDMRPILTTIVLANVANVFFNWVLIYGHLGFPGMGAVGSAWASTLSRWVMFLLLVAIGWKQLRPHFHPLSSELFRILPLVRTVRLGAPIGFQMQLEFSAFAVLALLMGYMGTVEMAAHQAAIALASMTFMVPMGVGAAAAVLVGHGVGHGSIREIRMATTAALLLGGGFMAFSALVMLLLPTLLAQLFTNDLQVVLLAAMLIPIAGVFQIFDGLQAVAVGVLRGLGDTVAPMVINLLGFWLIGLPLCIYLGFYSDAGATGLWWGMVAGLFAVAVLLLLRIRSQLARKVERVMMDG
jgi:MATE family multidrug resistance protein